MTSQPRTSTPAPAPLHDLRTRITRLAAQREYITAQQKRALAERDTIRAYLAIHDKVSDALESLNQQLFRELLGLIEEKLTIVLQEVLDQPLRLRAVVDWKRAAASVEFWVERDGKAEDIMKGQGGSVANLLSVGLRMFALTTLDEQEHRRFLVLDEQDCWIRPDLVPRLVKIVHEAGKALGFQTLMISHHDLASFSEYADKIYQISPNADQGVVVAPWRALPTEPDT
jgi:ABC-type glutathione transport system ATPase component